ncbi:MAG: right-handed parallel beta-helix repeat-containing protein [Bacteroidota bacterium]
MIRVNTERKVIFKNMILLGNRYAILAFMLSCTFHLFAADIHVSVTGENALTGRGSESAPYQTISYLFDNNLVNAGDVIILHEGTYRETVIVDVDNITLRPLEGDCVVISGANVYGSENWQADSERDGVYKMTLNSNQVQTDFTQLFVNGKHQQIARFPNNITPFKEYLAGTNREMTDPLNQESGFAILLNASKPSGTAATGQVTFSNHEGTPMIPNVTLTDEAIVRGFIGKLRNNIFSYSQDGGEVTRAGDRLVTFKSFQTQGNKWGQSEAYSQPEGFGYLMDLTLLDQEGEWFFKQNANTLYYKPEGGTLDDKLIEVKLRKNAIIVEANDVKLENIHVTAASMEADGADNLSITNCFFTYLYPFHYRRNYGVFKEGIILNNSDNVTFESSYIAHTWGSGIIVESNCSNTIINNCVIEDIGWMGQFTVSLLNSGNNTTITNNTFGRASRFHIRTTESVYAKITDNDFYQAMAMGEDAGSIMFTSTGKPGPKGLDMKGTEIAYNKVHDMSGIPAFDTSPNYRRQTTVAFYLEDVHNYTVHHNLAYNIKGDTYESKRGSSSNAQSDGKMLYLGPREKVIDLDMGYYNNTFWNYDKFLTFWHRESTAMVDNLFMTNNLYMEGKINTVSNIDEPDLDLFAQRAASSLNYDITVTTNAAISNADNHFEDASQGDFRLSPSSSYNSGGTVIEGITTSSNPSLGAWEGSTQANRERVFNAGSDLIVATDTEEEEEEEEDLLNLEDSKSVFVYPNPVSHTLILSSVPIGESYTIVNLNGELVKRGQWDGRGIDTSMLTQGLYFLLVNENMAKFVKK